MKSKWIIGLLLAPLALCAIDGTVVNKSTGLPGANITVTLVKPGQGGMRTLGTTVSDATGHFAFEHDEPGGGPQLLQAAFEGVNYNKLMTPVSPKTGVELDVFASSASPAVVAGAQQFMVLEPDLSRIAVNQTVIFQNQSTTTFNDEKAGTFLFYLPRAANGQVKVNAQGPGGMPLPRAAEKTNTPDVFKISYPVKPGETQFEISYVIPAGPPFTFRGRVVPVKGLNLSPLRVIAPNGVTFTGKDVQNIGTEPKTQATIYNVSNASFSFDIAGTGSLRPPDAPADSGSSESNDSPGVTRGQPQIYRYLPWLLGLVMSILSLGLVVLYRSSPVRSPYES